MIKTDLTTIADGYPFDLQRFLESRGLATAASGSGKSWLLRRIIEQALPHVQVLIIDPEGEFHTLREQFDLLVCAPAEADAVATPDTAPLLVRYLLEAEVSAVFNIYDLKADDRQRFVRAFCEALVNAPRPLWHNVLVVIDEAHIFCPEGAKSVSGQAVIDLATRGRKRGFGLMLATQRLAKLHKDAAGEMLNKLIGRTSLPNDIKRAADELGESPKEMAGKLRDLSPGEWYAYGPAFPNGIQRIKVGSVMTTHPQPGKRLLEAPNPPGPKIRALLAEHLKDLPKQAEEEIKTRAQLEEQIKESRETIRRLTNQQPKAIQTGVPEQEVNRRIQQAKKEVLELAKVSADEVIARTIQAVRAETMEMVAAPLRGILNQAIGYVSKETIEALQREKIPSTHKWISQSSEDVMADLDRGINETLAQAKGPSNPPKIKDVIRSNHQETETSGKISYRPFNLNADISNPQQRILDVLAQFDTYGNRQLNRTTLAVQSGVSSNSSGYRNNLSVLRTAGLIDYPNGGTVVLTDAGRGVAKIPAKARTLDEFHTAWYAMVSGPQGSILQYLISIYDRAVTRSALADAISASENSSGFRNNLSVLHTMGAIEYPRSGEVKASALMFPKGVKS